MKQNHRVEVLRSDKLVRTLATSIRSVGPRVVIESGTYLGTGSTRLILEALGDLRPEGFYTIEVSPSLVDRARANLAPYPWVQVVWGLSVTRREAITFIESDTLLRELDPKLDIFVDFLPDPRRGYINEISHGIGNGDAQHAPQGVLGRLRRKARRLVGRGDVQDAPQGLLAPLLAKHRADRPLITLDSAGGIGWLEFQVVRETMGDRPYLLFLDDINHVKHYRSKLAIESSPEFAVYGSDFDEGWMVAGHRIGPQA